MTPRRAAGTAAVTAGIVTLLAFGATFPGMMFGGCTEVGVPADHRGWVSIRGIEGGDLLYSPKGVNECRIPLPIVLAPVGLLVTGGVALRPTAGL